MLPILKKTVREKKTFYGASSIPFNPIDANTIALWDGDQSIDPGRWIDLISSIQITFFNAPTVDPIGLNNHGIVTFDGINQYGNSVLPVIATPHTLYLVLKQNNWSINNFLISDGLDVPPGIGLTQNNISPRIRIFDADSHFTTRLDLILNTWAVITMQSDINIYNLRTDLGAAATGIGVNPLKTGINLANYPTTLGFINCDFAYIIMRDVADNTATQNKYINFLKNRFAI